MISRRDWWIGVALVTLVLLLHALLPRYEVRIVAEHGFRTVFVRVDRWRGTAELGGGAHGAWWIRASYE